MAYVIVEFGDENGRIGAVHKSWLTPLKKQAYWPPYKEQEKFDKALRCGENVQSSWTLWSVDRIFYQTDDILKARQKLKEAEFTSSLESECDEAANTGRQKRKKASRKLFGSSEEDSEEEEESLPRPPPIKRSTVTSRKEAAVLKSPRHSHLVSTRLVQRPTNQTDNFQSPQTSKGTLHHQNAAEQSREQLTVTVVDKLIALVARVKEQNDEILSWIAKQDNKNTNNISSFGMPEIPFSLPLQTQQELLEFNSYLINNGEKYTALGSYLTTLGGDTITSKTNRILKNLISDSVASQFNFYGQRSTKQAFSTLLVKSLIVDAVKKSISNATDKAIEDTIKTWLKHAQERLKKENVRKEKIQS
uniref:DUF4806 domain-containing protein n=1 Tax=Photinus pyralis TaxID=7054 RepID=A0A1Y1NDB3_PHOPY